MMLYMHCHRTSVLKACFNCPTLTRFHNFSCGTVGVRFFSSPSQADLVGKGTCNLPLPPPPQSQLSSPLMLVPPCPRVGVDESESSADHNDYFHFFSPAEQARIRVKKKLIIPGQKEILTPDDAVCVGSSHGWLAFVNPRNCCPYLFNPLIRQSSHLPYVPLPPFETLFHVLYLRAQKSDLLSPSPSLVKDFMFRSEHHNRFAGKQSECFIQKVALSSAPSLPRTCSYISPPQKYSCNDQDNCTVVIIDREDTYFCKLGDERWHMLDESRNGYYDEVIYFSKDQRFYAMSSPTRIEALDLSDPSSPKREMINPSSSPMELETTKEFLSCNNFPQYLSHLVESSSGELLFVIRFFGEATSYEDDRNVPFKERKASVNSEDDIEPFYQSLRFDVYKLNFDQNKWESVECLGDEALFVGRNHSFSLSTRDYPGLRENSIYFTDHYQQYPSSDYIGHDNGIFHMKDKSITPYYPLTLNTRKLPQVAVQQPVWVAPNKL